MTAYGCESLSSDIFMLDLQGTYSRSLELNVETNPKWQVFPTPLSERWLHICFILNGELYIHGGTGNDYRDLPDMWALSM